MLLLALAQRRLIYAPDAAPASVGDANIPGLVGERLTTSDGETLAAWRVPARDDHVLLLYLHGNAGTLADRARRFRDLTAQGEGLLAIDWRGYGGSTGAPSQEGLMRDADAAWDAALK